MHNHVLMNEMRSRMRGGREFFMWLVVLQTFMAVLLAPAVTCGGRRLD